ncbi:calpain-10 isoform X4 [Erinaceus europaeus]|uniref:Calpain-10 isoform X4 n=1 Tax=Erinaceus europaeus TaxID=9365 RepID=A0ABM3XL62_ERIEU|nr:calpain-10 isoform X4 [Erinaceus europaeus]
MRALFRDAAFPAADAALLSGLDTPLGRLRGEEICPAPRLFADGPQEDRVRQGLLGDCWFLCACAALSRSPQLLHQVFPADQPGWLDPGYQGSFTCRVWQFGHWVEVTVDDRLPCLQGRLCFSRCGREDVFWLPLLEKAYAKVCGSYERLWAGQVADALVDLTGGLAERWSLKDAAAGDPGPSTCRRLLGLGDRCLVSCSVLSPRAGARELGEFHAFIVSDLREARGQDGQDPLLLRIQNPWARRCWRGRWTEGGEGWARVAPEVASELQAQLREGEFWVDEEEFLREFDEVTVAYPLSTAGHLQSLYTGQELPHTQQLPGAWVKGQSAGGCRNNPGFPSNPKFWLRVWGPSEVLLALLQRPGPPGKDHRALGLHIWKVDKRRVSLPRLLSGPPVAGTACHAYDREVHLHCQLTAGYYLVVPSTFLKDVAGRFLLRVFSSGRVSLSAVKSAQGSGCEQALPAGEWETVQLQGAWRSGQTAGGSRNFASYARNPQFPFAVPGVAGGPRWVRVTLRQHCQEGPCHPIGFHIFRVPAEGGGPGTPPLRQREPVLSCVPHCYAQEVSRLAALPAGSYTVVPSTYLPDAEGTFTLTVATRIDRRSIHSRELLGQALQEASFLAVRKV